MAIETLAFLAASLYATGVGSYFYLKRRAALDRSYERIQDAQYVEMQEVLQDLDNMSDDEFMSYFRNV
jgi:hypothetical protein